MHTCVCIPPHKQITGTIWNLTYDLYYTYKILKWILNLLQAPALQLIHVDPSHCSAGAAPRWDCVSIRLPLWSMERRWHTQRHFSKGTYVFSLAMEQTQSKSIPNLEQMTEANCKESLLKHVKCHICCYHLEILC